MLCTDFSSESLWWTCFVQYFLDTGFYRNLFGADFSSESFKRNVFEGILVIRSSVFLVKIPFPNLLAGNVPLEILSYRFLSYFFGSDFSSKIFWYLLSSDFFWEKYLFKVCLVDNYSSEILGTGFCAEIFWQ